MGKRAGEAAGIKPVQKMAMALRIDSQLLCHLIVKGPAYIVMAADIVYPGAIGFNTEAFCIDRVNSSVLRVAILSHNSAINKGLYDS